MSLLEKLRTGLVTDGAEQTREVAGQLAAEIPFDTALALHGDLGVGKTTFVQGLARGLGVQETVTSPTFGLYSVYRGRERTLVHLDAYRLEDDSQIEGLLLEEFLLSPWCLAVEWPEKVEAWLPPQTWHLTLAILADGRHELRLERCG
ncbi:MAG TPA: tRNA (adenosine(37)-N6)-threonylcarbamoyltransferase complex ATPase subunit type 1 TsaE [Candidatus Didemnitutus sp.]|nr:tRNA (adenosine(37)-N6)-threonylcarbamoyltransferase complex ATPase subunit type 1 TsaE [Candidatus Didemnitutus sp.]